MTDNEKAEKLAALLLPDVVNTDVLLPYISLSGEVVIARRFPFGGGSVVPEKYENIQLQIALELYNKKGAEGQTQHAENGITRTWASANISNTLLMLIIPLCESVVASNANSIKE